MRNAILGVVAMCAVMVSAPITGYAQSCEDRYVVQSGDSLSSIAARIYGDAGAWERVFAPNADVIGTPDGLRAGMVLSIDCPEAAVTDAAPRATGRAGITLLTAGGQAPFVARDLPGGGMMTDLVGAVMARAAPVEGFAIHWVEDRAAHVDPLLSHALLDLGFAWTRPDCAADAGACADLVYSDPFFEMLMVLFTDAARPVAFAGDGDLAGRRLCRPTGLPVHDLDRPGRRWISDGRITLERPRDIDTCFAMLAEGRVDAVAVDEFTGRAAVRRLGMAAQVRADTARPLSIETLHVIAHARHPRADALIGTVNDGLTAIRADGTYQAILDAHLARFWAAM